MFFVRTFKWLFNNTTFISTDAICEIWFITASLSGVRVRLPSFVGIHPSTYEHMVGSEKISAEWRSEYNYCALKNHSGYLSISALSLSKDPTELQDFQNLKEYSFQLLWNFPPGIWSWHPYYDQRSRGKKKEIRRLPFSKPQISVTQIQKQKKVQFCFYFYIFLFPYPSA